MPSYDVTLDGFADIVRRFPHAGRAAVVRGLRASALLAQGRIVSEIGHAKPYPAVDTGALRSSVSTELVSDGAVVTVDAPYAAAIEFGTRAFTPPLAPLAEWALRKGLASNDKDAKGIAFAVQKSLAKKGIAPRHFVAKALTGIRPLVKREIDAELQALGGKR